MYFSILYSILCNKFYLIAYEMCIYNVKLLSTYSLRFLLYGIHTGLIKDGFTNFCNNFEFVSKLK